MTGIAMIRQGPILLAHGWGGRHGLEMQVFSDYFKV